MAGKKKVSVSLEEILSNLENIVEKLNSGDLPLDEALLEFERGIKLAKEASSILMKAKNRVEVLSNEKVKILSEFNNNSNNNNNNNDDDDDIVF